MAGTDSQAETMALLQERHGAELLSFTQKLTHNSDQARDVVQDVMLRAWRHPEIAERDENGVRAWLFTVARNLVIDRWRSASVRHETTVDFEALGPGFLPPRDDSTSTVLDRWLIADALRQLTHDHRVVIIAAYYQGRPVANIAASFSCRRAR